MPAIATKPDEPQWEYFPARRFVLPDFDAFGLWLLGRMKEKNRDLPERLTFGWLKGLTSSNEHLFLTNEKAVLLAEQTHSQMNPIPKIEEVFCYCQEGSLAYGASLYSDMLRWAKGLGAHEIVCGRSTDVPQQMIEEVIGHKLFNRKVLTARIV